MKKSNRIRSLMLLASGLAMTTLLSGCSGKFVVFDPQGPVAQTQYRLIILSAALCAIVVIPVLAITAYIVWKYRDTPDNKAPYAPHWDDSKTLEIVWWGIPIVIVAVLGYFTARDTYALAKPPVTDGTPIEIQVTSLDWKWLFQYPEQNIATVNYVHIPAGVQVHFELTSDAPMNSFWVPQLAGQEYTMPGMAMSLWLQADKPGEYYGTGANFTGKEFAHMRFNVIAEPQADFNAWVEKVKASNRELTQAGYDELAKPGSSEEQTFSAYPPGLFDSVVDKNGGGYMNMSHDSGMAAPDSGSSGEEQPPKSDRDADDMGDMGEMGNMGGMDHMDHTGGMDDMSGMADMDHDNAKGDRASGEELNR